VAFADTIERSETRESRPRAEQDQRQSRSDSAAETNRADNDQTPKRRWPLFVLAVFVLLTIIGAVVYWMMTRNLQSTDDAYTEGNAIAFAPKVSGYVTQLNIDDNMLVHKGDLLLKIDPRDYIASRDQAKAALSLAQSQLSSAQVDLEITRIRAPATLQQAQAQLAQAQARVRGA
jgi:membrane fusion protein (multidrug efflux system)